MGYGSGQEYSVVGKALGRMVRKTLEELEAEGDKCTSREKGINFLDGAIGIAGLALGVAALFTMPMLIVVSTALVVNLAIMKSTLANESIDRSCDDIPFLQLDEKMKARQAEQDKKIAEQTEILKEVNAKISQTLDKIDDVKREMNMGFQRVLDRVGDIDASNPASDIKTAIESIAFSEELKRISSPDRYVEVIRQETAKKSDSSLYNYIGMQGSLYKTIFSIINKKNTINPSIALPALNAGVTTYASTVFNLFNELRYMSEYSYQNGDLKKFNKFYQTLVFDFNTYKLILNGSAGKKGMIDQVTQILKDAKNSRSKQELGTELFNNIGQYITAMEQLKQKVSEVSLNIIETSPEKDISIDFNSRKGGESSSTNFLEWKEGSTVSYAIQYESDGKYSKVGAWTSPQEIMKTANPDIELRKPSKMNRLVFRKFGNGNAELAYTLPGSEVSFRDVHRDLYNLPSKRSLSDEDVVTLTQKLMNLGASTKAVFEGKRTVIHAAAAAGRDSMINELLKYDSDILKRVDRNGYTALHIAAENKKTAFVKELIKLGANVNAVTSDYKVTPLHLAIRYHAEEIVDALLGCENINPNLKDVAGLTPLHYAITDETYNKNLFTKLVKNKKTDLNARDNNGAAVVHYATILDKWEEVIDMTFEGDDRFNIYAKDNQNMLALHYEAMKGKRIEQLISSIMADEKYSALNEAAGDKKWTPLHYAAYFKQTRWVSYFFEQHETVTSQIKVDAKDVDNQTPLHLAAAAGFKDIVKILLNNGAKVYQKTKLDNTPLDLAIMHGKMEVIEDLLTYESKQKLKNGKSAREVDTKACSLAKGEILNLLKKKNRCNNFRRAIDANVQAPLKTAMFEDKPLLISQKSKESFALKNNNALTHIDVNGALFLLDVFVRKMTNAKYNSAWVKSNSNLDAHAQALNLTDNIQRIIESAGLGQSDMDLFDIHSKIYKAIMSGNDYKLVKEVCSYLNEYSSLEPQKIEKFISEMLPNKSVLTSKRNIQGNLENLVAQACYPNYY